MSPFTFSPLLILNNEHPITPPPELVRQWCSQLFGCDEKPEIAAYELARWAAHWGADQELEACCADIHTLYGKLRAEQFHAARRPKPSLKEQALAALNEIEDKMLGPTIEEKLIRRALETLPE